MTSDEILEQIDKKIPGYINLLATGRDLKDVFRTAMMEGVVMGAKEMKGGDDEPNKETEPA